jgi:hypothetical protein
MEDDEILDGDISEEVTQSMLLTTDISSFYMASMSQLKELIQQASGQRGISKRIRPCETPPTSMALSDTSLQICGFEYANIMINGNDIPGI